MSTPDFRQPDPASALKSALAAHAKVTDALREAAAETRKEDESQPSQPSDDKRTGDKQP